MLKLFLNGLASGVGTGLGSAPFLLLAYWLIPWREVFGAICRFNVQ